MSCRSRIVPTSRRQFPLVLVIPKDLLDLRRDVVFSGQHKRKEFCERSAARQRRTTIAVYRIPIFLPVSDDMAGACAVRMTFFATNGANKGFGRGLMLV